MEKDNIKVAINGFHPSETTRTDFINGIFPLVNYRKGIENINKIIYSSDELYCFKPKPLTKKQKKNRTKSKQGRKQNKQNRNHK